MLKERDFDTAQKLQNALRAKVPEADVVCYGTTRQVRLMRDFLREEYLGRDRAEQRTAQFTGHLGYQPVENQPNYWYFGPKVRRAENQFDSDTFFPPI